MQHGTYIGPDTSLQGEAALLRPSTDTSKVLAQFDNRLLTPLAYGWTEFRIGHFRKDK